MTRRLLVTPYEGLFLIWSYSEKNRKSILIKLNNRPLAKVKTTSI